MDSGGPNVVIHRSLAFTTDNAVISGTGINIQHLLNLSIIVTICVGSKDAKKYMNPRDKKKVKKISIYIIYFLTDMQYI